MLRISREGYTHFIEDLKKETLSYNFSNMWREDKYLLKEGKDNGFDIYYTGKTGKLRSTIIVHYRAEVKGEYYTLESAVRVRRELLYCMFIFPLIVWLLAGIVVKSISLFLLAEVVTFVLMLGVALIYRLVGKWLSYSNIDSFIREELQKNGGIIT